MSVKFRKLGVALTVLATAAFVAVGCGDDGGDGGGDGDGANLAEKQELVVNIASENEAGQFNPTAMSYLDSVNTKGYVMFDGLYRVEGDDNELTPHLATGEPEISEDGLTYTVELRDDAKWSDGEPLVAQHVVDGVRFALKPDTGSYFAGFMQEIVGACEINHPDDIESCPEPRTDGKPESLGVTAVDEHTVEFKLDKPVPWFNQLLAVNTFFPLRQDLITADPKGWTAPGKAVSSGPFVLEEYKPGDRIVYSKNEEWWGADDVELEKLTFLMIDEPTTAAREFERGNLDTGLQNVMFDSAEIDKWKADDRFESSPTVGTQYMYMNTRNPELSDPKVRQALALAIDRSSITENITKKGDVPTNTVVPTGVPGYDVWSEGAQDFLSSDGAPDPDKAKELLDEAGWDENEELTLYFASDSGNGPQIAEQIQSDLSEVGVKVKLMPGTQDSMSVPGVGISPVGAKVDMILQGWIQDYLDAQDWYQLWYSKNIEAGYNSSNYASDEFDEIYEEALETVDDEARFELYKEIEAKLTGPEGDMPAAPLYVQADATLVQPWVQGFDLTPSGQIFWEDVSITDEKDA